MLLAVLHHVLMTSIGGTASGPWLHQVMPCTLLRHLTVYQQQLICTLELCIAPFALMVQRWAACCPTCLPLAAVS